MYLFQLYFKLIHTISHNYNNVESMVLLLQCWPLCGIIFEQLIASSGRDSHNVDNRFESRIKGICSDSLKPLRAL